MKRLVVAVVAAVALCGGLRGREVGVGVRVSSFGFDPKDSTEIIQRALDSGARRIVLDRQAGPWVTRPLFVRSNTELLFEEGVELVALRGAFKDVRGSELVTLDSVTNVTLRGLGRGAALRMWKEDYLRPPYAKSEWRHALNVMSSADVRVENLRFVSSGGDGVYLGSERPGLPNRNVVIRDCVCDGNNRQGISVISVDGLLVERTVLKNTRGAPPQSGIDFEPNHDLQEVRNVTLRECRTENNAGAGYEISVHNLTRRSKPVSIALESCRSDGDCRCPLRVFFEPTHRKNGWPLGGSLVVSNCTFRNGGEPAVMVVDKPLGVMDTLFADCLFENCPAAAPSVSNVRLGSSQFDLPPTDGIRFRNVTIRRGGDGDWLDGANRPWRGERVRALSGDVTLVEGETRRRVELDEAWRRRRFPDMPGRPSMAQVAFDPKGVTVVDAKPGESVDLSPIRFRGKFVAILYAARPGDVTFEAEVARVNGSPTANRPFVVADLSGRRIAELAAPTTRRTAFAFAAPEAGFYRVTCDIGPHALVFAKSDVPLGVLPDEANGLDVFKSAGDVWFAHRAGADSVVFFCGGGLEYVSASVFDPAGMRTAAWANAGDWRYEILRADSPAGLWRISLRAPDEGYAWEDSYLKRTGEPSVFFLSDAKYWK